MKQKVLLMTICVLAICNTNAVAQFQHYNAERDGFEWYYIWDDNDKWGAIDKYGNLIVPMVYSHVIYWMAGGEGFFICDDGNRESDEPTIHVVYNRRGQVLFKTRKKYTSLFIGYCTPVKKFRMSICRTTEGHNKYGIINMNEEEIVPCIYDDISGSNKYPIEVQSGGEWHKLPMDKMSKFFFSKDFFKDNKPFTESVPSLAWNGNNSSSSYSSTSTSSSSSRTYYDALAFDLKGHVKSCIVENNVNDSKTSKYEFKTTGEASLIIINGMRIPSSEIRRDSSKRIQGFSGFGKDEDGYDIYKYYYNSNGTLKALDRMNPELGLLFGSGFTTDYEYNSKGIVIAEKDVLRETKFNVLEVDSHNNWTKRTYKKEVYTIFGPDTATVTETRTIEYW